MYERLLLIASCEQGVGLRRAPAEFKLHGNVANGGGPKRGSVFAHLRRLDFIWKITIGLGTNTKRRGIQLELSSVNLVAKLGSAVRLGRDINIATVDRSWSFVCAR